MRHGGLRQPTALDRSTAIDRGYSQNRTSNYLEQMLGGQWREEIIFPSQEEQLEREQFIAVIVAARKADAQHWQRATAGVKRVLQRSEGRCEL